MILIKLKQETIENFSKEVNGEDASKFFAKITKIIQ